MMKVQINGQLTPAQTSRLSTLDPVKVTIEGMGTFLTHAIQFSEFSMSGAGCGTDRSTTTVTFSDLVPVVEMQQYVATQKKISARPAASKGPKKAKRVRK